MKKVLVTGGTVFVSRYIAEYYVEKNYDVYVLNRNSREQSKGVKLIQADRHHIGEALRNLQFDVVIDTAYTSEDEAQPFEEDCPLRPNKFWGKYGTDKIEAEAALWKRNPNAYILRPPYLYGQMNNVYREAFVFDCALAGRKFYLPGEGEMKLQFFHVHDLCRFIDALLEQRPSQHIFNVGNKKVVSIREWAALCYRIAGCQAEFVNVHEDIEQRNYFSFYDYEYQLDVSSQYKLMPTVKPLSEGLKESFEWYINHAEKVNKKPYINYIDENCDMKWR